MNFSNFFQNMFVGGLGQNDDFAPISREQSRPVRNNSQMFVPNENNENVNMDNFQPRRRTQNMQGQQGMQMPNSQMGNGTSFDIQNLLGNLLNMLLQLLGLQSDTQDANSPSQQGAVPEATDEDLNNPNMTYGVNAGQAGKEKGAIYLDENGKVIQNYKEPVFNGEVLELDIDSAAKIFAKVSNTSFQDEKEILLEDDDYIATGKVKVPAEWARECGYAA